MVSADRVHAVIQADCPLQHYKPEFRHGLENASMYGTDRDRQHVLFVSAEVKAYED